MGEGWRRPYTSVFIKAACNEYEYRRRLPNNGGWCVESHVVLYFVEYNGEPAPTQAKSVRVSTATRHQIPILKTEKKSLHITSPLLVSLAQT